MLRPSSVPAWQVRKWWFHTLLGVCRVFRTFTYITYLLCEMVCLWFWFMAELLKCIVLANKQLGLIKMDWGYTETSFLNKNKHMERELLSLSCKAKSVALGNSESHLPKLGRSALCLLSWHLGLIWSCILRELEYLAFLFLLIRWPEATDTYCSIIPLQRAVLGAQGRNVLPKAGGWRGLKKPAFLFGVG